ncbi:hypothetical protein C2E23DRAFT_6538 [Lenzites betulinus]|nr:hypothetical protein C2E23DRAFT_6538 [Lenzites betulinus]
MPHPVLNPHETTKVELAEWGVDFKQTSVLDRLRIMEVDSDLVRGCKHSLLEICADSVKTLRYLLSSWAKDRQAPELVMHADENAARGSKREREMHEPLRTIFEHIRRYDYIPPRTAQSTASSASFNRCFINQTTDLIGDQYHTLCFGFPRVTPAFTLFNNSDMLERLPRNDRRRRYAWNHVAFIAVKAASETHPFVDENYQATLLLTQVANYARVHLSARPFAAFSVGIMIYGDKFCVGIFDRLGVQLSPQYNMWADLDIFIRIVYSMTHLLTEEQLGRDPSVTLYTVQEHGTAVFGAVNRVGEDPRQWLLSGEKPLWSSFALFGRGTTVWKVREDDGERKSDKKEGAVFVMKSSWRSSKCRSESDIYMLVSAAGGHPGLAKFVTGGDAAFPVDSERWGDRAGLPITVHRLREAILPPMEDTLILHRIVLASEGRPIWEYGTAEELVGGMLDALTGHKWLVDQNILHRNINAGNILLSVHPHEQGARGFLIDLEHAQAMDYPTTTSAPFRSLRGTAPTPDSDSLRFMSRRLLLHLRAGKTSIQNEPEDDVESFFWVLLYAIFRKIIIIAGDDQGISKDAARKFFADMFGQTTIFDIYLMRSSMLGLSELLRSNRFVGKHITHPLHHIIAKCYKDVRAEDSTDRDYDLTDSEDEEKEDRPYQNAPVSFPVSEAFTYAKIMALLQRAVEPRMDINSNNE